jgi:hypothetical protein
MLLKSSISLRTRDSGKSPESYQCRICYPPFDICIIWWWISNTVPAVFLENITLHTITKHRLQQKSMSTSTVQVPMIRYTESQISLIWVPVQWLCSGYCNSNFGGCYPPQLEGWPLTSRNYHRTNDEPTNRKSFGTRGKHLWTMEKLIHCLIGFSCLISHHWRWSKYSFLCFR